MVVDLEKHESPINLFKVDLEAFPEAAHIGRGYSSKLNQGDCLYIPSYFFYQVHGQAKVQPNKQSGYMPSVITVSLQYKTHSALLSAFYEAIERGNLT